MCCASERAHGNPPAVQGESDILNLSSGVASVQGVEVVHSAKSGTPWVWQEVEKMEVVPQAIGSEQQHPTGVKMECRHWFP